MQPHAHYAAHYQGCGKARQTKARPIFKARNEAHTMHQGPSQTYMHSVHDQHDQHCFSRAQMGTHDAGHACIPSIEQQSQRQGLQQRRGQQQNIGWRIEHAQKWRCKHQGHHGHAAAHPSTSSQSSTRNKVGFIPVLCSKVLADHHPNASAHQAKDHEQQTKQMIGERKCTPSSIGDVRRKTGAQHAHSHANAQL